MQQSLMQLDVIPDLYVDASLVDAYDKLLFLSLWGRDTAIQEFLAGISLANEEGGINSFFLSTGNKANGDPQRKLIQIGEAKRLNHYTGRMPASNVFGGDMAHLWVFDRLGTCTKQLPTLASHLQPVFARSSISKPQNRTTIPTILLNQNEQIRTKSERHTRNLFRARPLVTDPDLANRRTIAISKIDSGSVDDKAAAQNRIWQLTKAICHLPLLDHWAETIIQTFYEREWIKDFNGIGVNGALIDLSLAEEVEEEVTRLIRDGALALN